MSIEKRLNDLVDNSPKVKELEAAQTEQGKKQDEILLALQEIKKIVVEIKQAQLAAGDTISAAALDIADIKKLVKRNRETR